MPKTTKEIIEESNFNYLYPQASLKKIEETDNKLWFSQSEVDEIKKKLKEELDKIHINNRSRRNMIIKYINIIDSVFDEVTKK